MGKQSVACSWTLHATAGAPSGREGCSAILSGDWLVTFGGYDGQWHDDLNLLNIATWSWSSPQASGGARPVARSGHTASLISGARMVVFGGFNGSDRINAVMRDVCVLGLGDVGSGSLEWVFPECSGSLPPGRESHCAEIAGHDQLVVFGGYASAGQKSDMFVLDCSSWVWSEISQAEGSSASPAFPIARSKGGSFLHGGSLYVFGGDAGRGNLGSGSGSSRNDVMRCCVPGGGAWEVVPIDADGDAPDPRNGLTIVQRESSDNDWIVFGGTDGERVFFNDVWALRLEQDGNCTWVPITLGAETSPKGREWHCAVWQAEESRMIVFGGSLGISYTNEVWTCEVKGFDRQRAGAAKGGAGCWIL